MIFTVIGHLCKDVLHIPDAAGNEQPPVECYGGILYAVLTIANIMGSRDVLQPVFGVGSADYEPVLEMLKKHKNVDSSGVFRIKGQTNQVHIFYEKNKGQRIECSKNISPPIPFNRIKPFLDADALLINMISGSDITLETLDYIRMEVRERRVPIYFDFHALTLGIDQDFKRFPRPLTDWRRWCFMLHGIQMSEAEAHGLSAERYDEGTLINHLMPLMVGAFNITRGDRGLTLITQDIHKKLTRHDIDPVSIGPTVDTTGCGDVFGAAYIYHYMKSKDSLQAVTAANRIAAYKATFSGLEGLSDIPKNGIQEPEPGK
jgi:sugar/nucleoside kinase (ribokinase family)